MAHWYPVGQHYFAPQQQQLGQLPDIPYGSLQHPACLAPSYNHMPYAYGSVPMTVNGVPHVWVPVKLTPEAAPYPQTYGQMQAQQAVNSAQQIPYREAPRPAHSRCMLESDPLQMAWPDSPMTAHQNGQVQNRVTDWGTNHSEPSWNTASRSTPSPPRTPAAAGYCNHTQQAQAAFSRQLAQMSLSDEPASSQHSALPGRSDASVSSSAPAEMCATSEAAESADDDASGEQATLEAQCSSSSTAQQSGARGSSQGVTEAAGLTWQWLTEGLLKDVMSKLPQHCRKRCRLICKRWKATMDLHIRVHIHQPNIQELAPRHAQIHATLNLFPALTALDLSGCQNVRNRNLAILSKSGLKMKKLAIGHVSPISYGKPRITNQALQSIAEFKGLRQLVLADCSAVTTGGLEQLSGLVGLQYLALLRCPRVGDKGMTMLKSLTCLTYLALTGCTKVADGSMKCVSALPSLQSLVLGFTRVQDTGMALLTALPGLTHLALLAEGITQAGLLALSSMTILQSLGVSQCNGVTGDALVQLLPSLPVLTHLNFNCLHLTADHIDTLVKVTPQLGYLGLQGSPLGASSLMALAALSGLRRLSLSTSLNTPHSLTAVTCLPHLTALQVQGIAMAPGLMHQLGHLSALQGLDVHGFEGSATGYASHMPTPPLHPLSQCKQLRWLDISHWTVKESEVTRLVAHLPALQHICVLGCPISDTDLVSLEAKYPKTGFQKLPKGTMWESHTAM